MGFSLDALETRVGYPIEATLEFEDCTVVLFETEGKSASTMDVERRNPQDGGEDGERTPKAEDIQPNTNICAIDTDGQLRWTVAPQVSANSESRYTEIGTYLEPPEGDQVWVKHSDGRVNSSERYGDSVWARHTSGYVYVLNKHDGSVVEKLSGATNTLSIDDTAQSFEYPIEKTVQVENRTLVLLEINRFTPISDNRTELFYQNIVALDDTGARVWQIEGLPTTRLSGGYTDLWTEESSPYARHDVYGSVRIDPLSGAVEEVTAATRQNVLFLDRETAVVFPSGLGNALDRGTHVVTRMAPEDWADDASMYRPDGKRSDLEPSLEMIVELTDLSRDTNVFSVDKSGELRWTIDPAPAGEKAPRYTEVGTHFQIGDDVWAKHSNGRLYQINEQDGTCSRTRRQSEIQFSDSLVEFPYDIKTVLETDETVVILLEVSSLSFSESAIPDQREKPFVDRNILGFDRTGNLRWIIDAVRPGGSYVEIWKERDAVGFYNWDSCKGKLDPHTGAVLESYFEK